MRVLPFQTNPVLEERKVCQRIQERENRQKKQKAQKDDNLVFRKNR